MTPFLSHFANILNYSHKPNHCLIVASFIMLVFLIVLKTKLIVISQFLSSHSPLKHISLIFHSLAILFINFVYFHIRITLIATVPYLFFLTLHRNSLY